MWGLQLPSVNTKASPGIDKGSQREQAKQNLEWRSQRNEIKCTNIQRADSPLTAKNKFHNEPSSNRGITKLKLAES